MLPAVSARAQLDRIKGHWQQFWFELKDFYDNKRWREVGYASFSACVEAELGLSRQRAAQILDAAIIRESLSSQPGLTTSSNLNHLTERQARELKPLPPAERADIVRSVDLASATAPQLRQEIDRRRTAKACTVCGTIIDDDRPSEETNYYSFDGTRLWCIPCGRKWLAEQYPGYRDPAWGEIETWSPPPGILPNAERSAAALMGIDVDEPLPVPPVPRDHGLESWFETIAEEVLTRFDPTWLDWDAPAAVGPLRDADWWAENRPLLDALSLLLRRLASPACETSALKRNSE